VVYTGCVGDDDLAQQLKAANKREGLAEAYLVKKDEQTGACAVVITGHHRYFIYSILHILSDRRSRSGLSSPLFAPQRNLTKPICQLQR
jgi:adenosine kinase